MLKQCVFKRVLCFTSFDYLSLELYIFEQCHVQCSTL